MINNKSVFTGIIIIMLASIIVLISFSTTQANSPAQSSTPVLTLTPALEENIDYFNILILNEDCELPCWWGLTLGNDDIQNVDGWFTDQFGPDNYQIVEGDKYIGFRGRLTVIKDDYPEPWLLEGEAYNFIITARLDVETRKLIQLDVRVPIPYHHRIDWTPLSPASILSRYGEPDEASLRLNGYCCLYIIFRYRDMQLFISYDMYPTRLGEGYSMNDRFEICNGLEQIYFDGIVLWLETEQLSFESYGLAAPARTVVATEINIEDATGLTLAEFTEVFSQENTCITTLPIMEWRK